MQMRLQVTQEEREDISLYSRTSLLKRRFMYFIFYTLTRLSVLHAATSSDVLHGVGVLR